MKRIPLSPIDRVFTGAGAYPLEFVFAYRGEVDAGRLEASLRRAIAAFPAMSSRLVPAPEGCVELEPSPDGCVFETASHAGSFAESAERYRFVSPVESVEGEPLTRIRVTRTADGAVLGISVSHAVVDGFSFFYFLSAWARIHRGLPVPPPSHDRALLVPAGAPTAARLTPRDVLERCGLFWGEVRPSIRREDLRWERLLVSRDELGSLLAEGRETTDVRLSHNDVLTAWLWRRHADAWAADGSGGPAFVSCPVDCRRLIPALPATYFGCAVAMATQEVPRERVARAPLGELAVEVRRAVAGIDGAALERSLLTLDALRRQEGAGVFERCHVVHPRAGLLVTNLSRLPAHEVEFDAGPPVAFDILTPARRCAVVLPAADGVDVRICK